MSVAAAFPSGRRAFPSRFSSASNFPGPQLASTLRTVASSTPRSFVKNERSAESEMMAPTFRSRFGQPSRRCPIPGANELSTVEWHSAHWMPRVRRPPFPSENPVTPRTAFEVKRATVTAGSSRFTLPTLSASIVALDRASTSTLSPTESAALGLTPGPTPPSWAPSMVWCSRSVPPQKSSSPKGANRKDRCCSCIQAHKAAGSRVLTGAWDLLGQAAADRPPLTESASSPRSQWRNLFAASDSDAGRRGLRERTQASGGRGGAPRRRGAGAAHQRGRDGALRARDAALQPTALPPPEVAPARRGRGGGRAAGRVRARLRAPRAAGAAGAPRFLADPHRRPRGQGAPAPPRPVRRREGGALTRRAIAIQQSGAGNARQAAAARPRLGHR